VVVKLIVTWSAFTVPSSLTEAGRLACQSRGPSLIHNLINTRCEMSLAYVNINRTSHEYVEGCPISMNFARWDVP
jgi:hypothetical protein